MAGKGGARPGSGRPAGVPNKATTVRLERVESTGSTPLDVMVQSYRMLQGMAAMYQPKLADGTANPKMNMTKFAQYLKEAALVARDAAPYVHSRLSAIQHMGKGGGPIEYSNAKQKLADLVTREADADAPGEPDSEPF